MRSAGWLVVLCVAALLAGGCSIQLPATGFEGAGLGVKAGTDDGRSASARFKTARYAYHDTDTFTAVLLPDGDEREAAAIDADNLPGRAVTLRLMWRSKAARTPIDPDATNCGFQYVVVDDDGELGVYSGAGFILLSQKPGANRIDARILKATLLLSDATEGYDDPIGRAEIAGRLTLVRDDAFVTPAVRRLNAAITQRLTYPRLVDAEADTDARPDRPATIASIR